MGIKLTEMKMLTMKENSIGWREEERGMWTCERGKEGRKGPSERFIQIN